VRALIRQPSPSLAEGLVTHIDRQPVDVDLAQRQWHAYCEALTTHGWELVEVPSLPQAPDSVFVEDTMVWWGGTALISRPGAPPRRIETAAVADTMTDLGARITTVAAPDTLDGGDVLHVGDVFYVGVGGRTTAGAVGQLAAALDVEAIAVPVSKVLHLKSAVTSLPDGTVVGYPPLVDDSSLFDRFLAVPEESGAHVVVLGHDSVLMAASAPRTAELLRERGLTVTTVDISEFEKLEGCVTCLSVRLR
jgi:dimethylargininase